MGFCRVDKIDRVDAVGAPTSGNRHNPKHPEP